MTSYQVISLLHNAELLEISLIEGAFPGVMLWEIKIIFAHKCKHSGGLKNDEIKRMIDQDGLFI